MQFSLVNVVVTLGRSAIDLACCVRWLAWYVLILTKPPYAISTLGGLATRNRSDHGAIE
jgi:hypothetical protein